MRRKKSYLRNYQRKYSRKTRPSFWKKIFSIAVIALLFVGLVQYTISKELSYNAKPAEESNTVPAESVNKSQPNPSSPTLPKPKQKQESVEESDIIPFSQQQSVRKPVAALKNPRIEITISNQTLSLFDGEKFIKPYPISSSKYGIGNAAGSNKTPLGKHVIAKKIGEEALKNTIFKARQNSGEIAQIDQEEGDLVTSRIMWLKGLESGINSGKGIDSYNRFIYIHGTAEEKAIGKPASHGCIRMYNDDVIELFNLVKEGTPVDIKE